jgi:hypothetical protein
MDVLTSIDIAAASVRTFDLMRRDYDDSSSPADHDVTRMAADDHPFSEQHSDAAELRGPALIFWVRAEAPSSGGSGHTT